MAAMEQPRPDDLELDPIDPSQPGWEARLQAQLDWLMSDDDPWADLEEEPPCFCTARLSHSDADALQTRLTHAFPELQAVPPDPGTAGIELKWPENSFAWASWLDRPPSFRGAGEVRLADGVVEIWTPTRGRMRQVLRVLLALPEARVELRELVVEDPFESLPAHWGEGDDLNPEVEPSAFDFLLGTAGADDGPDH